MKSKLLLVMKIYTLRLDIMALLHLVHTGLVIIARGRTGCDSPIRSLCMAMGLIRDAPKAQPQRDGEAELLSPLIEGQPQSNGFLSNSSSNFFPTTLSETIAPSSLTQIHHPLSDNYS